MNQLPNYLDGVIEILTKYIENRTDHFTMNFDGGHYIQGPYVQALQEHDNVLLIEASSNQFLNPPLSEMANQKMIFMGWRLYPESYLPNYTQLIDQSKVSPREIADIMVRAIHFACGVDDTFALEINPKIEAARHIFDRIGAINE